MHYPDYFPENCPPNDCETTNKLLYRFCKGDIVCENDFLSYFQLGKKFNDIIGYGLSMLSSLEEAKNYLLLSPKLIKDKKFKSIAKGYTESDGVWKHTPTNKFASHVTWWLKDGAEPWKRFEIVEDL